MLQPLKRYEPKEKMQIKAKVTFYGTVNNIMDALTKKLLIPIRRCLGKHALDTFLMFLS